MSSVSAQYHAGRETSPFQLDKDNEKNILYRFKNGDQAAFDLLFTRYQHRVLCLIGRTLNDPDDVQDVAQEAFVRAFRALPQFRGESSFYTWLCRIVFNTVGNHVAAKCRRPPAVDIDVDEAQVFDGADSLHDEGGPVATLCRDELWREIGRAIRALPDDLRCAIALRELEGMSYEQIARVMECPIGTVRSRIFRARAAIDERIKPLLNC